jgi:hypothetical protein
MRYAFLRCFALFTVLLVLAASSSAVLAASGPPAMSQGGFATLGTLDLVGQLRGWFARLSTKIGCTIDPSGSQLCGSNSGHQTPVAPSARPAGAHGAGIEVPRADNTR